jgi:hypothetical protein
VTSFRVFQISFMFFFVNKYGLWLLKVLKEHRKKQYSVWNKLIGVRFPAGARLALGPTKPGGSSSRVKWLGGGGEADHSPPSSAEDMNNATIPPLPHTSSGRCSGHSLKRPKLLKRFICLRTGVNIGLLWTGWWKFVFHKMIVISWVVQKL